MAVTLSDSYTVGDTVRLRPTSNAKWCDVTAPDGRRFKLHVHKGHVQLWLAQPGTWAYSWTATDQGQLNVATTPRQQVAKDPQPKLKASYSG